MSKTPSYRHHKASGQAVVWINGRDVYLGEHNSDASREKYHRLIAEQMAGGLAPARNAISISELCLAHWRHAKEYYRQSEGSITSSLHMVRQATRRLRSLYGSALTTEFGPLSLQAVRRTWIDDGLTRRTVNGYTSQITRIFKWGVAHELVDESTYRPLTAVSGLRQGRSPATEPPPKVPVPIAHVDAIKPYVSLQVWSLVQLQLLTSARSGELVILRPIDFDTSGTVWVVRLSDHKTAHRGKDKILYFGPQAQLIISRFMAGRPLTAFLFSPKDAQADRHVTAPTHRRNGQTPTPRKTGRTLGERYTPTAYRRAIARACKKAGVPHWHPHRLRHNAATHISHEFDIETARIILGHSIGKMTELYAERDTENAMSAMSKIG